MGKKRDYGGSEDSPDACFGGLGSGLTTLTGIVAPLVWGSLFRHFQRGGNALARVLGPGGHYCIAAGGFLLTAAMSRAIPAKELSLDAAGSPAPRRSDERSAEAKPA